MKLVKTFAAQSFVVLIGLATWLPNCYSAEVRVSVVDRKDRAVPNVVVYAEPKFTARSSNPAQAVMNQVNGHFAPHILVVETGTDIVFPNTDVVSHHVYSFSEANRFELPLYKGMAHPPRKFDKPGLVVLGCNIHDNMLGYVLIVDSPHFALTDEDGSANIPDLAPGEYTIRVWTPRAQESDVPDGEEMVLDATSLAHVDFRFSARLHPPHESADSSLSWVHY